MGRVSFVSTIIRKIQINCFKFFYLSNFFFFYYEIENKTHGNLQKTLKHVNIYLKHLKKIWLNNRWINRRHLCRENQIIIKHLMLEIFLMGKIIFFFFHNMLIFFWNFICINIFFFLSGRPIRYSKQKALNQVKAWCGSIKPDDAELEMCKFNALKTLL